MEPKKFGRILGRLLSVYDAAEYKQTFIKKRVEEIITDICSEMPQNLPPEELERFYKEFVEGVILVHVPLSFLTTISSRLPGQPIIVKGIPIGNEPVFRDRRTGDNFLGVNDSGKLLIRTMINAIIMLVKEKKENTQKSRPQNVRV